MELVSRREIAGVLAAGSISLLAGPIRAEDRAQVIEAAKREGKMALATSVSAARFPMFLDAFTRTYPFLDVNSGYYSAPTGRVLARVDAEINAKTLSFDVIHLANLASYIAYSRNGELLAYRSPELAAHASGSYDRDQWATARIIGVIMAYNRNVLAPGKAPNSWHDLLKPEFKGRKLIIQDSAAGTTFNQFYIFEQEFGVDFLKKLAAQEPVIVATAPQLIDLLVRGEALVGATVDHFRAFEAPAVQAGIVGVYPSEGMPVAAVPIAILRDAPHPNAARLFIDFALSREGQRILCLEVFGVYSTRQDIPPPPGELAFAETRPLRPKDLDAYAAAAARFPEHFDALFM